MVLGVLPEGRGEDDENSPRGTVTGPETPQESGRPDLTRGPENGKEGVMLAPKRPTLEGQRKIWA